MLAGQFEKDFRYLMPLIDKVAAEAAGLSDSAARDEVTGLIADEKERWARIRQLLEGSPASSENPGAKADGVAPLPSPPRPTFTVGSLRRKRD